MSAAIAAYLNIALKADPVPSGFFGFGSASVAALVGLVLALGKIHNLLLMENTDGF